MAIFFAVLLGALLGAGFGLGGVMLWLVLVVGACALHDACTARRRRETYLRARAAAGLPPSGL
jgi:hypothetical protein